MAAGLALGGGAGAAVDPPPRVEREPLGDSFEGRPIAVTRLGRPGAARQVLVVGAIHGDEGAGRAVVDRLLADREVPEGAELLLVRNLNPDGAARRTRLNARGVDLNRNSAWRFGQRQPTGSAFPPGPRAFSEPETRAIRALILRARPDVVVWYHQPLALVDRPEQGSDRLARRYAARTGLPLGQLSARPGSMSAWTNARVRPGSSFVVEFSPRGLDARGLRRHVAAVLDLAAG